MKISIITATYNSESTLSDTIESVLSQTISDYEYIIVDGKSSDNTIKIVEGYLQRFAGKLKYVSEKDKGLYDAINKGIRMATGDIIGILNSDDYFHRNNILETILNEFELNDIDAIFGDSRVVKEKGDKKNYRYTWSRFFRPWMFRIGLMPPHPSFYAKKELFDKYGYYKDDFKIAADFDLMSKFFCLYHIKTKYIPCPILTMRHGGLSTSINNKTLLNKEQIQSLKLNGFQSSNLLLFLKYPFRLIEFIWFKKRI